MKGLIVKYKDKVCKASVPLGGALLTADVTWHSGAYWSVGGLKMPEEVHFIWNSGMLEVGDVIEVEVAEFDEASMPVADEKHSSLMKKDVGEGRGLFKRFGILLPVEKGIGG